MRCGGGRIMLKATTPFKREMFYQRLRQSVRRALLSICRHSAVTKRKHTRPTKCSGHFLKTMVKDDSSDCITFFFFEFILRHFGICTWTCLSDFASTHLRPDLILPVFDYNPRPQLLTSLITVNN